MSTAGALSGTPTSPCSPCTLAVAVSDSARGSASGSFTITIASPLQITTTSLTNGTPNAFYQQTLTATGGFAPYTWSITQGSLPGGLTLNATSGVISGTPTNTGTSNFTVQLADNGTPPATLTANLSIMINAPPPRAAALYDTAQYGRQIGSNGSLALLPSSPELAITMSYGSDFAVSPTLPLIFQTVGTSNQQQQVTYTLNALLVNPDYSLSLYDSSGALPNNSDGAYGPLSVDPTGSNLYVAGFINSGQTTGILIYAADGSFQSVGSIAVPNLNVLSFTNSRVVFNPDSTLAFAPTTAQGTGPGGILSFSRATNGTLTLTQTYNFSGTRVPGQVVVAPDGNYLAETDSGNVVQVFSVASDGTLTPATGPFTVTYDQQGDTVDVSDLTWDSSGAFLLLATSRHELLSNQGGVAVLSFSGSSLSETVYPSGTGTVSLGPIRRTGQFVYAAGSCPGTSGPCPEIFGFDFQNGQLEAIPGSPWMDNVLGDINDFVIY